MKPILHPVLSPQLRQQRLMPPKTMVRVVLDTDAFNEVDDQFAMAYLLRSSERANVMAITAAPFYNWNSSSPEDGMNKSYYEIHKIFDLMGETMHPPVFKGSTQYMQSVDGPLDSSAADEIIRLGLASPMDDPLYVISIGAVTNISSAIVQCPQIIQHMVVVWLGPNAYWWKDHNIFNVSQDYLASSVIYESGVPLVILPCHCVASHLHTNPYELDACLKHKNRLCDYFCDLFHGRHARFGNNEPGWSKVLWDVSAIAWLVNDQWVPSKLLPTPMLRPDFTYEVDPKRDVYREAVFIDRSKVFADMFKKLSLS